KFVLTRLLDQVGMARGVISDKWSMRVLWLCAIGSGITLFMVAQERQLQNRQRMLAEGLKDTESGAATGEEV
ncbi:hypothetical protein NAB79_18345, partial [Proteus mirabilis]|nr:hypothetical protein [Proteus mirabilis]